MNVCQTHTYPCFEPLPPCVLLPRLPLVTACCSETLPCAFAACGLLNKEATPLYIQRLWTRADGGQTQGSNAMENTITLTLQTNFHIRAGDVLTVSGLVGAVSRKGAITVQDPRPASARIDAYRFHTEDGVEAIPTEVQSPYAVAQLGSAGTFSSQLCSDAKGCWNGVGDAACQPFPDGNDM